MLQSQPHLRCLLTRSFLSCQPTTKPVQSLRPSTGCASFPAAHRARWHRDPSNAGSRHFPAARPSKARVWQPHLPGCLPAQSPVSLQAHSLWWHSSSADSFFTAKGRARIRTPNSDWMGSRPSCARMPSPTRRRRRTMRRDRGMDRRSFWRVYRVITNIF